LINCFEKRRKEKNNGPPTTLNHFIYPVIFSDIEIREQKKIMGQRMLVGKPKVYLVTLPFKRD